MRLPNEPPSLLVTIFWVGLTVFGTGLYLMPEERLWGTILTLVGLAGILFSVRGFLLSGLAQIYRRLGVPYPRASLIIVMLFGAFVGALAFGGIWKLARDSGTTFARTVFRLIPLKRVKRVG